MTKIVMDQRKWTLVVILLIALGIGIYNLVSYTNKRSMQTVSFKNCKENYYYSTQWPDMEGDEDHAAKGRLARCLCQSYLQKPDTSIARKIMEIYNSDGRGILFNTSHNKNYNELDSIIKYQKMAFDTVALYD